MSKKNLVKIYYNCQNWVKLFTKYNFLPQKTILISDKKIWQNCQKTLSPSFINNFAEVFLLNKPQANEKYLQHIKKAVSQYQNIVALGSGTINDLCKLISHQQQKPYIIIASAPSMNGYLSQNASITIKQHKKTLLATLPIVLIANTNILQSAPEKLIKAGIGDAMCFYNCWFDWWLANQIFGTPFLAKPFLMLQKLMQEFCQNYQQYQLNNPKLLKLLMQILLISGKGMTLASGSYPASQSEHLLAHCLTTKYSKKFQFMLHGELIAFTTFVTAQIQENLLDKITQNDFSWLNKIWQHNWQKSVQNYFSNNVYLACLCEFTAKTKILEHPKKLSAKKINNIQKKLSKIHFSSTKISQIFTHFHIKHQEQDLPISSQEYSQALYFAKYLRNRITCLDFIPIPIFK